MPSSATCPGTPHTRPSRCPWRTGCRRSSPPGLRRQRARIGGIGEQRIGPRGRFDGTGLIGRQHRVDRIEIGRQGSVAHELRHAVDRRLRRIVRDLQAGAIGLDNGDLALGRTLVGVGVFRRAGADQPEMIEIGAAERAHEEIVRHRVAPRDLPQRKVGGVRIVIPHNQAALVGKGDEPVVLAPVDLHLVLIEQMPGTLGDHIEGRIEALGVVDRKGRIGQMLGLRLGDRRRDPGRESAQTGSSFADDAAPSRIALRRHGGGHTPQAVGPGEEAVEVIEAAILGVDHHDGLDLLQSGDTARRRLLVARRRRAARTDTGRHRGQNEGDFFHRVSNVSNPTDRQPLCSTTLPAGRWWNDAGPCAGISDRVRPFSRDGAAVVPYPAVQLARRSECTGGCGATARGFAGRGFCPGEHSGRTRPRAVLRPRAVGLGPIVMRLVPRPCPRLWSGRCAAGRARRQGHAADGVAGRSVADNICRQRRNYTEHFHDSDDDGDASVGNGPTGGLTWDGRVDRGSDQARLPLLSPFEMANDGPAAVVAAVGKSAHAGMLRHAFGAAIFADTEKAFDGVLQALEAYEQRHTRILSLQQQV